MLSAGTGVSSKRRMPCGGPLLPIMSGIGSMVKPGAPVGTTSAVSPRRSPRAPVRQQMRWPVAKSALVM